MKTITKNRTDTSTVRYINDGKLPYIFSREAATYWDDLASYCIRSLFPRRGNHEAKQTLIKWIKVLRESRLALTKY